MSLRRAFSRRVFLGVDESWRRISALKARLLP
jgi:hypothetical protein